MKNIPSKSTGDTLEADDWNSVYNELKNIILSVGLVLTDADVFQVTKSISIYAANGDFYTAGGTADAITLTPLGSKQAPPAYEDGQRARFIIGATNTGAVTVNIDGIGVIDLKKNKLADDLVAGDLPIGYMAQIQYDDAASEFELISVTTIANAQAIQRNGYSYGVDSGAANAYEIAVKPIFAAYVDGLSVYMKIATTNTGNSTLDVNGIGTVQILDLDNRELLGGELQAGVIYNLIYSSTTSKFYLQSKPDSSSGVEPGDVTHSYRTSKSGWLLMDDGYTIAKTSGGTYNGTYLVDLYTVLWDNQSDAKCPVAGGRGASAQADFDANKTLQLPLQASRAHGGAGSGTGLTARALGDNVGEETHQLTVAELAEHDHSHDHTTTTGADFFGGGSNQGLRTALINPQNFTSTTDATTAGSDTAHNNMQPTHFLNTFIKI